MTPKGVAVFCVIMILSFQMLHVTAFKQEYSRKGQYGDANLPDGPSSAIDTGMQALLAACDFVNNYKLAYLVNGYFALRDYTKGDDDVCKDCGKKIMSTDKAVDESFKDKVLSYVSKGFTTKEGIALLTFMGSSVCDVAESYRKK